MARVNGIAVAAIGGGSLFVYAGIKGYSVPHAVQALVQGKPPSTGGQAFPVSGPGGSAPPGILPAGSGGKGSTYSNGQLQSLWVMAGGSPAKSAQAACIAEHESSGDSAAESPNPDGGTNVGLWQLDTRGKGAGYTVDQLKVPLTNARAAVAGSSNGTDWSAWSTAAECGA